MPRLRIAYCRARDPREESLHARVANKVDDATASIAKFLGEEQDAAIVRKVLQRASEICTAGEDIHYMPFRKSRL